MGVGVQQYFAREDGSGNVYWLVQDTNDSVRDVLNGTGTDEDSIEYTAYGVIVNQTNSADSGLILYDAYRVIFGTPSLYETPNRIYDAATGKWLENDPDGFFGGLPDLSDYVGNNPTNATDPTGLFLFAKSKELADEAISVYKEQAGVTLVAYPLSDNLWVLLALDGKLRANTTHGFVIGL